MGNVESSYDSDNFQGEPSDQDDLMGNIYTCECDSPSWNRFVEFNSSYSDSEENSLSFESSEPELNDEDWRGWQKSSRPWEASSTPQLASTQCRDGK